MCKEFDGDCFKFFQKYIDLKWITNERLDDYGDSKSVHHDGQVCTPKQITQKHWDNGILYICPPANNDMTLNNNFEYFPHKDMALELKANYNLSSNR